MGEEMRPFFYIMVVWNDDYIDMMLDITIPSLLAEGNIPDMPNNADSRFIIITTLKDNERIVASEVYKMLSKIITVEFPRAEWLTGKRAYWLKAAMGHQEATKLAIPHSAY